MKYQPLIVDSDYRVLAVTPERKHLLWLVEGECDCQLVLGVHELSKEDLADLLAHPWNWSYKPSSMQNNLVKSPNDNVKERSLMLQNKLWAYYDVLTIINYARVRVSPVVNQQDLVYLEKERQARQVRFGITDDCQMVRDYADFANCTLAQAAEQILFKAELADCFKKPFITKWLFDIEIIARMQQRYKKSDLINNIYELPLNSWHDVSGSKLRLKHIVWVPFQLILIYCKYKKNDY